MSQQLHIRRTRSTHPQMDSRTAVSRREDHHWSWRRTRELILFYGMLELYWKRKDDVCRIQNWRMSLSVQTEILGSNRYWSVNKFKINSDVILFSFLFLSKEKNWKPWTMPKCFGQWSDQFNWLWYLILIFHFSVTVSPSTHDAFLILLRCSPISFSLVLKMFAESLKIILNWCFL